MKLTSTDYHPLKHAVPVQKTQYERNENRNNNSYIRCSWADQEGTAKHIKYFPGAIKINELQQINYIRNGPHTEKGFVLKAEFISPVVP